jgi:uncharacterized protein (DUF697 family)
MAGAAVREVGVVPTTATPAVAELDDDEVSLRAIDVAGFGEARLHQERVATMMAQLPVCHLALMVVGLPDRALELEVEFLTDLRQRHGGPDRMPPVVGACTKVDLAPPRREWEPKNLNLKRPQSAKEKNIQRWSQFVSSELSRVVDCRCVACAAGEFWNDGESQYGISDLRSAIHDGLPEAARTMFARVVGDDKVREKRAQSIILAAAASAALAGAQPVPSVPDSAVIAPLQISMIVGLAFLHGADPKQLNGMKLVGPILASVGGRLIFQQLLKVVPGVGSVLGAGVAGLITLSLGQTYHHLLKQGKIEPSQEEILQKFNEFYLRNKGFDIQALLGK